nr:MAG TPA: hypothetical protein [Caudoviricetes sp.]
MKNSSRLIVKLFLSALVDPSPDVGKMAASHLLHPQT